MYFSSQRFVNTPTFASQRKKTSCLAAKYSFAINAFMQPSTAVYCKLENECLFALMSLRLALMIVYFLVMNSKRCESNTFVILIKSNNGHVEPTVCQK